ncbi:TatD family hydrolase [Methylophaga sp. OBS1]|jgi:TatD DNase family protein|uniref:TatD family hydrolase n=1 Tax=Methylophaga sp. OBS1 TaxID=2991933 RepID=UPI002257578F|nr:TatD family hydrolase [Methylophaga sp. OBS1]MCX4191293.1 TatD family hydrolase [Methylophaga sp. OBS1]MCX4191761.1 TatD family hydrolase [Methylophaga sp. OBS1]
MYIDSHCHLNMLADEPGGIDAMVSEASDNGIEHILCIAIDKASCAEVKSIADSFPQVTASVGIHPNVDEQEQFTVEELVAQAAHPKVIAIGETGLDYFRSEGDLEWQRDRFRVHIEAAKKTQKPLIIHTREAREDTMSILENEDAEKAGGIIHCFTENWETAKRALDIGFYISLSGIVTFKSARELQDVAKKLPLDRMLIETDSPYLAPVPHRGKTNKPVFVKHVAEFLAELRGDTVENIAATTTANFQRLFPSTVQ